MTYAPRSGRSGFERFERLRGSFSPGAPQAGADREARCDRRLHDDPEVQGAAETEEQVRPSPAQRLQDLRDPVHAALFAHATRFAKMNG